MSYGAKMRLTVEEAADFSGIGRDTIRKLIDCEKLPNKTARRFFVLVAILCYNRTCTSLQRRLPCSERGFYGKRVCKSGNPIQKEFVGTESKSETESLLRKTMEDCKSKKHPIANRKLKTVTADHLQGYMDLLCFGGTKPDGTEMKALSVNGVRPYSAYGGVLMMTTRYLQRTEQTVSRKST